MANPLEQFEIKPLVPIDIGGVDASFTNAGLFMVLTVAAVTLFLTLSISRRG
ncbi:MAG TPA: F0F1 ATP synthase subunit A, partial [Rhodospirillales bacterium]|nr:F0F1 ATP synthase subunit A [Rhodospirillales bacterium]